MSNRHHLRITNTSECEAVPSPATAANLDTRAIFLALIAQEADSGRLTAWRRRRLIRFAAQLGLTPIEIGEFLANRKIEWEASESATSDATHELRLASGDTENAGTPRTSSGLLWGLGTAALGICLILLGLYCTLG